MTNNEAIAMIRNLYHDALIGDYRTALGMAIKALEKCENWTPVAEALPEEGKDVLVTVHFTRDNTEASYYVDLAYRLNDEWMSYSDDYLIVPKSRLEIIAWMPLQKPYVEREEDASSR